MQVLGPEVGLVNPALSRVSEERFRRGVDVREAKRERVRGPCDGRQSVQQTRAALVLTFRIGHCVGTWLLECAAKKQNRCGCIPQRQNATSGNKPIPLTLVLAFQ
jgi:hypothetical protein